MKINNQHIKSWLYKNWWLFYILFFLLLGVLIYALTARKNINSRMVALNDKLDKCYHQTLQNDSLRVVNNSGRFGCLSFTLSWNSTDDLDLHVMDAKKDSIYYKRNCKGFDNRFSLAGGQLDIDLNADRHVQNDPVENVYFQCTPPNGTYLLSIHAFEKRVNRPVSFRLVTREKGKIINEQTGIISSQDQLIKLSSYNYHGN